MNEFDIISRFFAPLAAESAFGLKDDAALLPARPGQTGVRSFGGDSSGSLVYNNAAAACCTAAGLLSPGCAALK